MKFGLHVKLEQILWESLKWFGAGAIVCKLRERVNFVQSGKETVWGIPVPMSWLLKRHRVFIAMHSRKIRNNQYKLNLMTLQINKIYIFFNPMRTVREWSYRAMVQSPFLEVLKFWLDKAKSILVWVYSWPYCEHEFKLETSFQPEIFWAPMIIPIF